jgi:hypothetical protein
MEAFLILVVAGLVAALIEFNNPSGEQLTQAEIDKMREDKEKTAKAHKEDDQPLENKATKNKVKSQRADKSNCSTHNTTPPNVVNDRYFFRYSESVSSGASFFSGISWNYSWNCGIFCTSSLRSLQ